MPHIFDFSNILTDIKTIEINPLGWVNPIIIEYGVAQNNIYDTLTSIVWRVQGTTHTFSIYEKRLNVISHGKYAEHFTKVLEKFREEYLIWLKDDTFKKCNWVDEYKKQYENFIIK